MLATACGPTSSPTEVDTTGDTSRDVEVVDGTDAVDANDAVSETDVSVDASVDVTNTDQ